MGRPRKILQDTDAKKETKTDLPPKKRKWKRGGVATRIRLRVAQKGAHPIPNAVMIRLIRQEVGPDVRWSRSALELMIEMLNAHVHRTLTITKATMLHAGKKTLTESHIKFGTSLAEDMM